VSSVSAAAMCCLRSFSIPIALFNGAKYAGFRVAQAAFQT
jgi:hypothetical protein